MKPSLKYGIFTGVYLILYFLLISLFGLQSNPIYSFFNVIILFMGIYYALLDISKGKYQLKYLDGIKTGLMTGVYATIIFTLFFGFYADNNPKFIRDLIHHAGMDVNFAILILTVGTMGAVSTMITTFLLMQYFKRKLRVTK